MVVRLSNDDSAKSRCAAKMQQGHRSQRACLHDSWVPYIISTFLPLLQVFEHDKFHMLHQARVWHLIQSKMHAMVYFIFI